MKTLTVLIAALSLAAPAFAQDYGYGSYSGDDDWSWQGDEEAPPPQAGPTLQDFQGDSELAWNGEWVSTPEYGVVWRPTRVSDDWQPYVYGHWVWTQAGWAWASDEPFGWAVYHYGRWAWTSDFGWAWVPGQVWAPAWVAWSWNDGYTGWCPLGPSGVVYQHRAYWVVVPNREFLNPVRHHVVPRRERMRMPLPAPGGPRAGPPVAVVERATGHTVRPLAIGDGSHPSQAHAGSGTVWFYRPRTAPVAVPAQRPVARPAQPGVPSLLRPYAVPQRQVTPAGPRATVPRPAPAPPPTITGRAPPPTVSAGPRAAPPHAETPHPVVPKSSSEQPQAKER